MNQDNYNQLIEYTDQNLDKLFMLSALVYKEYQHQFFNTHELILDSLKNAYRDKVKQVICLDLGEGTKLDPESIREFVEEILYLFIEEDANKYN
jgi:hypothetical protein